MLQISLLGKFSVQSESQGNVLLPTKVQELLSFLMLFANSVHTRESLANEFWAHAPISHSRKYLRQALWHLHTFLESSEADPQEPFLHVNHDWIQFNVNSTIQSDIQTFSQCFKQLKDKGGLSLSDSEAEALKHSISFYKGDLLSGWYYDWCILERERYRAMAMAQLDKLILYCLAHRQYESGIVYSMNVLQIDHTREKTHRQLMRLFYFSGDRTGALRQFNYCKNILDRELSVLPTQKTTQLYQQIMADAGAAISIEDDDERPVERKDKPLASSDGSLFKTLTQILTDMTLLRNDVELLKQSLNK